RGRGQGGVGAGGGGRGGRGAGGGGGRPGGAGGGAGPAAARGGGEFVFQQGEDRQAGLAESERQYGLAALFARSERVVDGEGRGHWHAGRRVRQRRRRCQHAGERSQQGQGCAVGGRPGEGKRGWIGASPRHG